MSPIIEKCKLWKDDELPRERCLHHGKGWTQPRIDRRIGGRAGWSWLTRFRHPYILRQDNLREHNINKLRRLLLCVVTYGSLCAFLLAVER